MIIRLTQFNECCVNQSIQKAKILTAGPGLPSRPSLPGAPVNPCNERKIPTVCLNDSEFLLQLEVK